MRSTHQSDQHIVKESDRTTIEINKPYSNNWIFIFEELFGIANSCKDY